jgi:phage-related protein
VIAAAIAGGVIGTLAMSTIIKAATELGLTRMDLPLLLGTVATVNRRKARAFGYAMFFVLGVAFAEAYAALFDIIGRSSWWLGALVGALHAIFTAAVLISVLLPVVHPRMATSDTAANDITLIEPPGFLMLNYGRNTLLVTLVAHMVYGACVGLIVRL